MNTSLREIQAALSASLTEASWITTAYLAAAIVVMPLTAWLTRVFSIRTYATVNTALFMVSLVACALAWDLNSMIALRFLSGLFGGGPHAHGFFDHSGDAAAVEATRRLYVVVLVDCPGADCRSRTRWLVDGHIFLGIGLLCADHPCRDCVLLSALRSRQVVPLSGSSPPDSMVQHRHAWP